MKTCCGRVDVRRHHRAAACGSQYASDSACELLRRRPGHRALVASVAAAVCGRRAGGRARGRGAGRRGGAAAPVPLQRQPAPAPVRRRGRRGARGAGGAAAAAADSAPMILTGGIEDEDGNSYFEETGTPVGRPRHGGRSAPARNRPPAAEPHGGPARRIFGDQRVERLFLQVCAHAIGVAQQAELVALIGGAAVPLQHHMRDDAVAVGSPVRAASA